MLGERTDGDEIHAGFSELTQGFMRHVARHFKLRLAVGAFDGFTHLFRLEVIEHDDIGSGFQRGIKLFEVFDFNLDRDVRVQPEGFFRPPGAQSQTQ